MFLQRVECMEKAMRLLAILYQNAGKLLKSNYLYKCWSHDKVGQMIHSFGTYVESWVMTWVKESWATSSVSIYKSNSKLPWNFKIQTDNKIEHKPEIVVLDKIDCTCLIIDVACPFDMQVKDKEKGKIENYQDLKQELKRIWKLCRVTVLPIIIGALGTVSKDLKKWLAEIGVTFCLKSLQRACLLGTGGILRKVLDT